MSDDQPVPQWSPTPEDIAQAQLTAFTDFVTTRTGIAFPDYAALWRWSISDVPDFWRAVWDWFDLGKARGAVLTEQPMPDARWFPGTRLNYVAQVVRNARTDKAAILAPTEDGGLREISWDELLTRTATLARSLRSMGVDPGDRVVGYLPNIPEAVIAFLATASLGAIWSACGQDYSAHAALDRLGQLEPLVLITCDGYRYGGKIHDKRDAITTLRDRIPSLRATIAVPHLGLTVLESLSWDDVANYDAGTTGIDTVAVTFDHPLWVLYSSGTTGTPKGIVHGHGGVLLEHLKALALQSDIGADDTFFWFTSPSWMMWNYQVAGLLVGATIVCYDGSPSYPAPDTLWDLVARTEATVLGTSPAYLLACAKAGIEPRREHNLTALRTVGVTGAALPASTSLWVRDRVGRQVAVSSISGGTDVVTAFAGGVRTVPVWPGELSAPYLGVALDAWDERGHPVRGGVGELVVTQPMPSMPVMFWNDPEGERYREAYFDTYPGTWRHGDWITLTSRGSVIVHGRSDSTLNRHGVRMGSADIYHVVDSLPEIEDTLVLGIEQPDGGYWMPMFVVLTEGTELTEPLRRRINQIIRDKVSPRHVPDDIIVAPGIPHTKTGKKLEVPLKKVLQGGDPSGVVSPSAVDDPGLIDWFATLRRPRN
ncbi:acetoacetate--CoA ligase [Nocardia sp. NPDC058633]|uniref:acetoacetate--CoA ligase n=1 Tax=Nocardia sp. NPDC058633 TaxID=3346568 RepID=UPI00365D2A39